MFAQCPHCQTVFAVSREHLDAAGGRVRCGNCFKPFNANLHWVDDLLGAEDTGAGDVETPALSDTLRQVAVLPDPASPKGTAELESAPSEEPPAASGTGPAVPAEAVPELLADEMAVMPARTSWRAPAT